MIVFMNKILEINFYFVFDFFKEVPSFFNYFWQKILSIFLENAKKESLQWMIIFHPLRFLFGNCGKINQQDNYKSLFYKDYFRV